MRLWVWLEGLSIFIGVFGLLTLDSLLPYNKLAVPHI